MIEGMSLPSLAIFAFELFVLNLLYILARQNANQMANIKSVI